MRTFLLPLALATTLVAGCSGTTDSTGEERSTNATQESGDVSAVSLEVLPGIAQPGPEPAPPEDAPVLVATVEPAGADTTIQIQRQDGNRWRTVARDEPGLGGELVVRDPALFEEPGGRFRAVAVAEDGTEGPRSEAVPADAWTLDFGDGFDGSQFDTSKWNYRQLELYNPQGSRQCSVSHESAVSVSGGTLQLQVLRDPERVGERCKTEKNGTHDYYLNGHIATEGLYDFRYGVAAARVKFQEGRGQHGAFWLQRGGVVQTPGDPGSSGAEIDVAEYFGEGYPKGGLASFLFYLNDDNENEKVGGLWPGATRMLPPGDDWWRSYHVFSVEWTPEEYVFRVDGREIFRTSEGISDIEQFLVLSLLTSDWELGKLDQSSLPSSMQVDWVRVWKPTAD